MGDFINTEGNITLENLTAMYEAQGHEMLHSLSGGFAFAIKIEDKLEDKIFAARDPFGTKPLYYATTDDGFFYGEDIKTVIAHMGFTPEINKDALGLYLTFQYSVLDETFFRGIYKLPPGSYLYWEDGRLDIVKYYTPMFEPKTQRVSGAIDRIDQAVLKAVHKAVDTEAEVGTFLSGGVDSGYLAATFGGKKSFTVGFDYQAYSEVDHAQALATQLGIENISTIISTQEYWDNLSNIQYHMEEPMADPAAMAFYFACREAKKHVDIALSGEGPDELFGGYAIYREPFGLSPYDKLPLFFRKWLAKLAERLPEGKPGRSFLIRGAKAVEERFIGNAYIFTPQERDSILKEPGRINPQNITQPYYSQVAHLDDSTKMQYLDINLWLSGDILLQAYKMSKAHDLEVRTPLLAKEVAEVAFSLPTSLRVTKHKAKIAFREAAQRHLPDEVATRKKLGFPVPIRLWLREDMYYHKVKESFESPVAGEFFNVPALVALLDAHKTGRQDNSRKIWTVYMFLLWHGEYFTN